MKRIRTIAAGIVSAVVLAVVAACGSSATVVPAELSDKEISQKPNSAFQDQSIADGQVTPAEALVYLETVLKSTDEMWARYFESVGGQYPSFFYEIVGEGQTFTSKCSAKPIDWMYNNAFFCDEDSATIDGVTYNGSVVLPLGTFMNMWSGTIFDGKSLQAGDFAAATIVMHEVAHSAWWNLSAEFKLPLINQPDQPRDKRNELIADCGAGLGANNAYAQGALDDTDVGEAVTALEAIGDAAPGGKDPHGTPQERSEAFMLGYNTGRPGACIENYWPGVTGG